MKNKLVIGFWFLFAAKFTMGQGGVKPLNAGQPVNNDKVYIAPKDSLVLAKLARWKDLKFGLFMHWGIYSEWGVVESWALDPEDIDLTKRTGPYASDWYTYKKAYENLQTTFNPTHFNPEKWANAAKAAGMKYMVFTTKHHDGFCMFDTRQTDYKITSPKTPFSTNPRANITKEVFNAFRKQDFMVGAYFSKPDWHSEYFWWPYFPPKDRNANYDPKKYPDRWQKFCNFTFNQIEELMTDYGPVDILWIDGGWVKASRQNQAINIAPTITKVRKKQPGLIVVERGTPENENYLTPEQNIPDHYIADPWETCLTMGKSWSYIPNENYKSSRELIQILVDVVAKNGNLLLNIGPGPDGDWHQEAYQRLNEIAKWMDINGESIFNTKPAAPYRQDKWAFTSRENVQYASYLPDKLQAELSENLLIPIAALPKNVRIILLGIKPPLKWKRSEKGIVLTIPEEVRKKTSGEPVWVFKIIGIK
jgi:alpha-L-fucosidase